ncbi:MAG: hypothetical protein EPO52_12860 [Herbiconiux sp.]|uniref:hypothetical protein n=1 Tax=Herbiconiux sp. TaxID=1871186 RepID=UPI0011F85FB9|nr:hypothetical protein [Herbiconiux sp.]TAJ47169.1 MAG: hypothetical protein EPO52_12860 [Herbiconiux sp.]
MSTPAGSRSGNGYWSTQIGATALLGAGCIVASLILLETKPDEPGGAVLVALIGISSLTTFGWAVDSATRSSAQERALFAWAIAQHEAAGHGNDARAMSDAARARDGELGAEQIRILQAFRPDNRYPALVPLSGAPRERPIDGAKNRIGVALIALFLALTGLYFSCIPAVSVLGWPFQLVATILAVVAIVPPGRGRRLGIAAGIVSVLGTLVTVVIVAWRIVTVG